MQVPATLSFDYPTVESIAGFIQISGGQAYSTTVTASGALAAAVSPDDVISMRASMLMDVATLYPSSSATSSAKTDLIEFFK